MSATSLQSLKESALNLYDVYGRPIADKVIDKVVSDYVSDKLGSIKTTFQSIASGLDSVFNTFTASSIPEGLSSLFTSDFIAKIIDGVSGSWRESLDNLNAQLVRVASAIGIEIPSSDSIMELVNKIPNDIIVSLGDDKGASIDKSNT